MLYVELAYSCNRTLSPEKINFQSESLLPVFSLNICYKENTQALFSSS